MVPIDVVELSSVRSIFVIASCIVFDVFSSWAYFECLDLVCAVQDNLG